jgi:hypothetical protein
MCVCAADQRYFRCSLPSLWYNGRAVNQVASGETLPRKFLAMAVGRLFYRALWGARVRGNL